MTPREQEIFLLTKRVIAIENLLDSLPEAAPAKDPQTSINKTVIERLDLIITHHQKELEKLNKEFSDFKLRILPVKKFSFWDIFR